MSGLGRVSRASPVQTALRNCTRDEGGPFGLPTGSYVMEMAEHREPYESRGSRIDLGAPGGESPPGDSTMPGERSAHPDRLHLGVKPTNPEKADVHPVYVGC